MEVGKGSAACPWPAGMAVGPAPLEMPAAQEGSNSSREELNWVEASCAFKVLVVNVEKGSIFVWLF